MIKHTCRKCGVVLTEENCSSSRIKSYQYICRNCSRAQLAEWRKNNPILVREQNRRRNLKLGHIPMDQNKTCPQYLNNYIAKRVLSKTFKNVKIMPYNNIGYTFVCNKDMKISVKSSCFSERQNIGGDITRYFQFNIYKNKIADYFLCLGFNNRIDTEPIHLWLLPGNKFNDKTGLSITDTTISKWDEYRIPIDQVSSCCEAMRS